ncbi:hypothetical protein [Aminobacter ciceronei]|uniref:DUF4435 domain-containing protein n=1 Tax=Aminobacter ciceronei TaxID=150723 RepID=A0ABR6C0S3_9HYPH|nr:hypothetical protein [Aminobacter ciceronei]MBA8904881.1 hypothetical protein [Aminobacter ciceronei]MBA9018565.1 hypothetical protein [Aminobacter ciceronei]
MKKLTVEPLVTGLNNQRLCLLGLVRSAADQDAEAVIPSELVDFTPVPKRGQVRHTGRLPIWDIFDREAVEDGLSDLAVSFEGTADMLTMQECFRRGSDALKSDYERSSAILRAFRPSKIVTEHANRVVAWLGDFTALQLRIERDWREYVLRKFGADGVYSDGEYLTTDPDDIFVRVTFTPDISETIWACCDEDDLVEPKDTLKRIAEKYGLRLVFKSDLPSHLAYPAHRLTRSAIDFAVAVNSPAYIGLTRSTFSEMVGIYRPGGRNFAYNIPGGDLAIPRVPT